MNFELLPIHGITGLLSFKWILWKRDFAFPRSVLEVLSALECLNKRSRYLEQNSGGTLSLVFVAILTLICFQKFSDFSVSTEV